MSHNKQKDNKPRRVTCSEEIRSKEHKTASTERPPKMKPESNPKKEQE